mmetsp:Transcript_2303/g.1641  ORF Transcript_2303/g.1641 Transcript_2303/m.1641 type:complete len:224 (+) Transcript_2303:73-744(+)
MMKSTAKFCQTRLLSTAKIQKTPEQIKAGLEKNAKWKTFNQPTSTPTNFSQVMGSGKDLHTPKNLSEIAALSGMPANQAKRTVVISQRPTKSQQSGRRLTHHWHITWKSQARWSNPLMGWTSTADPMSNLKLTFDTEQDAVAFAERNGWKYEVMAPSSEYTVKPGTYLYKYNFLDKRTLAVLKRFGHKNDVFDLPTFGESHWFMPLKYHGDGEVVQHGPTKSS